VAKKRRRSAQRKRRSGNLKSHLAPWARDAIGIGLVVVALLAILALWFESGGPFGTLTRFGVRGAFGVTAVAFPVLALYWGVLLLRDTVAEERPRMFIGFLIALAGVLGLLSLWKGNPSPVAGYEPLRHAGGLYGSLFAWPLSRVAQRVGAAIICGGLAFLGLLVFTGTPLSRVTEIVLGFFVADTEEEGDELAAEEYDVDGEVGDPEIVSARRLVVREESEENVTELDVELEEEDDEGSGPEPIAPARLPSRRGAYKLPSLDLLRKAPASSADGMDEEQTMQALERTFRTFGVPARVPTAHRGPTVTLYEVEVEAGTKVNRVLSLADDIAYALATPDVRIMAPIPGKSAIGVEVPNKVRDFVMLGDILRSKGAKELTHPLMVGLGKDVHGRAVMLNLAEMPHLLIAGATGAGKSSLINAFVTSIIVRTTPDDVKLVLIDPKRVELSHFGDLPHLLAPVIVQPKRAAEALSWVVREMELRYEMLASVGMRDIGSYTASLEDGTLRIPPGREDEFGHLPYLVVVIDELADLMMVAPRDVEDAICRIAQMARAVGIHLVVATQRPSVDVVTGLIKANIPSRIAFMTASQADSRVVLDVGGAEKLVGHGDMLFLPSNVSKPTRIQGAWVTEKEIAAVSEWVRSQQEPEYELSIDGLGRAGSGDDDEEWEDQDELFEEAAELVVRSQLGSTSMLQRKLKVGFARAGRLMDQLEEHGIVGPSVGSKPRDVLMTWEEWAESHTPQAN
jgi:S-DNA-T family DNA segregation ATPase FtsK/SpoIIIE